jgi:hypothetical protein
MEEYFFEIEIPDYPSSEDFKETGFYVVRSTQKKMSQLFFFLKPSNIYLFLGDMAEFEKDFLNALSGRDKKKTPEVIVPGSKEETLEFHSSIPVKDAIKLIMAVKSGTITDPDTQNSILGG